MVLRILLRSTNPPTCIHCTQCIHETCENLRGHHLDIQRAFWLFCICKKVDEYVIQTLSSYFSKPWHDSIRAETAFEILSQTPLVFQCVQVPLHDIWKGQSSTILTYQVESTWFFFVTNGIAPFLTSKFLHHFYLVASTAFALEKNIQDFQVGTCTFLFLTFFGRQFIVFRTSKGAFSVVFPS